MKIPEYILPDDDENYEIHNYEDIEIPSEIEEIPVKVLF